LKRGSSNSSLSELLQPAVGLAAMPPLLASVAALSLLLPLLLLPGVVMA
jgi:hypothetical protein